MATITALPDFSTIHDDTPRRRRDPAAIRAIKHHFGFLEVTDETPLTSYSMQFLELFCKGSRHYLFIKDLTRDYLRKRILKDLEALQDRSEFLNRSFFDDCSYIESCWAELLSADESYLNGKYVMGQDRFTFSSRKSIEDFCRTTLLNYLLALTGPQSDGSDRYELLDDAEFLRLFHALARSLTLSWDDGGFSWDDMLDDLSGYGYSFKSMTEGHDMSYRSYYENNAAQIKPIPKKTKASFFST